MAEVKSTDRVIKKWREVTQQRGEEYRTGIQNPKRDWAEATQKAEDNWKQGIQQAAQRGAFKKGVMEAGTEKWQRKAVEKGPDRFIQGVALSQDEYAKGITPYLETLRDLKLPPRYPKGDPRNLDRVKAVVMALRNKKTGRKQ
jgi:hypothetical protein